MTTTRSDVPLLWVVGAGGLLGSEVLAAAGGRAETWVPSAPVRWHDADLARSDAARAAGDFMARAAGRDWQVAWCAGAGITGTSAEVLDAEARVFRSVLSTLAEHGADGRGAVFLASSAGGVYAGSSGAPFDEWTVPHPLAPYGESKLRLETLLLDWSARTGVSVLVGRIANLYGPGQDLRKAQGLISHVCRAQLLRQPISIYVPLDTLRNYLFAPDCAQMVVAALAELQRDRGRTGETQSRIKILAGPEATSIAFILAELARIMKRRPLVVHGSSAVSRFQAGDLRVRSVVMPEIDAWARTPLVVGMNATLEGVRHALNRGRLT